MTRSPFSIYQVDPSHSDVRREIERMHAECFPGFDMVVPIGTWWFGYRRGLDEPVAFAALWPSQRQEGAGYLARAGVMPIARGHGLQKRLIKVREKEAKRKGWTVLFSDTFPANVQSMNNLFACGYRAFIPKEPWCGGDWIYFKKIIDTGVA